MRLQLGPVDARAAPEVGEITLRRYRCRGCGAVVTVVPRGVAPRLRYRLRAVAWALGQWWSGTSAAAVRRKVSPFSRIGEEAQRGWRSLRRWVRWLGERVVVEVIGAPHRQLEVVLQRLAARARGSTGDLVTGAVEGVVFVDVHHVRREGPEVPTT